MIGVVVTTYCVFNTHVLLFLRYGNLKCYDYLCFDSAVAGVSATAPNFSCTNKVIANFRILRMNISTN